MSILDMTGIDECPECGNDVINWDRESVRIYVRYDMDYEMSVHGTCTRCGAGIKAIFELDEPDISVDVKPKNKLDLPAAGKDEVSIACREQVKKLFERYHASLVKTRRHADGGQGADLDWDDWEFTVNGVQYTISEWGYSEKFTPNKCTAEFIEFIQPGAHKPPMIILRFLKKLGHILFKYRAALDGYGIPFQLPADEEVKATWDLRR
jgi:hypothetical protein